MNKKTYIGLAAVVSVVTIAFIQTVNAETELWLEFSSAQDKMYFVKNNDNLNLCTYMSNKNERPYSSWVSRCYFKGKIPKEITIEYTPWLPYDEDTLKYLGKDEFHTEGTGYFTYYNPNGEQVSEERWVDEGIARRTEDLDALPESSWRTFTIKPKQILEKYKWKSPEGRPVGIIIPIGNSAFIYPSMYPYSKDKVLTIEISLDENDNLNIDESFKWEDEYSKDLLMN